MNMLIMLEKLKHSIQTVTLEIFFTHHCLRYDITNILSESQAMLLNARIAQNIYENQNYAQIYCCLLICFFIYLFICIYFSMKLSFSFVVFSFAFAFVIQFLLILFLSMETRLKIIQLDCLILALSSQKYLYSLFLIKTSTVNVACSF